MKTVAELRTEIVNQVWPSGSPENLALAPTEGAPSAFELLFQETFGEIEKWVDCEQENHVDVFQFCVTFFKCAMTVVPAPYGVIHRVGTTLGSDWCDPVYYRQVEFPEPEWAARKLMSKLLGQVSFPIATLPLGFTQATDTTDSPWGRARTGLWAIWRKQIFIYPWIQSNERVFIEWDGIKTQWGADDLVTETQEYKKAVKLHFQYCYERDYGSMQKADRLHNTAKTGIFDEALADIMWYCRESKKLRDTRFPADSREVVTCDMYQRGLPPAVASTGLIAHVGGYADGGANAMTVAAMFEFWGLSGIISSGSEATTGDYDNDTGQPYHDYIAPYTGEFGSGAEMNIFWPTIGVTDSYAEFADFFPRTPNNGRYYEVCIGAAAFFILNSNDSEVDGNGQTSIQAEWLKARLALSTAPWKVVVLYHSPYSTVAPNETMQWPFESWGAHMVLSSSDAWYERNQVGNVSFINNGNGGLPLGTPGASVGNTRFQYNGGFGAGRITADPQTLIYEFVLVDGTVIDAVQVALSQQDQSVIVVGTEAGGLIGTESGGVVGG